jgi:hypothetical protein
VTSPQERGDELAELLQAITTLADDAVVGGLRSGVAQLQEYLVAAWVREFGSVSSGPSSRSAAAAFAVPAQDRVRDVLDPAAVDPGPLSTAVEDAWRAGVDHATVVAPDGALSGSYADDRDLPDLPGVVEEQRAEALSALSESAVQTSGFPAVTTAVAHADRSASRIAAAIAYEVTRAASEGVREVADKSGQLVVWVAERDACLHCLAYAGQTTTPTGVFPPDLTYGDKPLQQPGPLTGPGLHPHCRCTLEVLDPTDTAVPVSLVREAKRSVLRGWADQESEAARLRAAARLLDAGAGLPKTVEARARRAVRAGKFE